MKIAIHRDKSLHSLLIILLACLIIISGCGSGGGGSDNNSSGQGSNYIYGIASKGPIRDGFVTAYPLDENGTQGNKVLGIPTFTDIHGSYVINIGSYTGNVLVEVKGGKYTDEATGKETDNEILRAAVTLVKGDVVVMVTPFTEIAVQKALADGGLTTDKIDIANLLVSTMTGGVNIINTTPADVTNAESLTSAGPEEITYGLALAAISEMVNNKYAGNMSDAIVKISNDLSDNNLDSQAGYLKDSLLAFLINPNNQSGVDNLNETNIDESIDSLSDELAKDSNDINQLFKKLESLYVAQHPSSDGDPIKGWFNDNIAADYLHDGRDKEDEYDVWTGPGGLYDGITISVILLAPLDVSDTSYKKGYRSRIYFSGEKGWGNVTSSMVYDDTDSKWLWYGNQEWGVNLWNFQPTAEMTVDATDAVSFKSGLDVLIWDVNLSAYNHGIRSAIISGPGLPAEGLILNHYHPASYFSLLDQSHGSVYPLSEMDTLSSLDNAEYTVRFYTQSAGEASLDDPADQPVKTETRVFAKGPIPESGLNSDSFPDIIYPTHDISSLTVPGTTEISWNNPDNMAVDDASLSWIDANNRYMSISVRPETDPLNLTNPITAVFDTSDTEKYMPVDLTAQLYMQGNDAYGRRFSVNWELWKQAGLPEDVIGINNVFNTLEDLYSNGTPDDQVITDWYTNNVAPEYLHDGRNRDLDRSVWSGPGGLYEGISISAVLLEQLAPGDLSPPYSFGYWVRLYFSGPGGTGSILTSMVYNGAKWLWYGNRDWGLDLTGFRPWAEKAINYSNEISLDTGFEVIIWDSYLSAYNKGVKSAVITGPGLPDEGVKLEHYYNPETASQENYFSRTPKSVGYTYSLTDDQISQIHDDAVYTINFYTKTADELTPEDQPVRTENRVISRGPVSRSEIESQGINSPVYFPSLITPIDHALSAAKIGGDLDITWINPLSTDQMAVNFVSLGWLDPDNEFANQYSPKTVYDLRRNEIPITETITTTGSAAWMAQLYLRGEDAYNRRFTLSWEFLDPAIFTSP